MARGRHDYEKKVISVESEGYRDLHGRILMQDDFEDTPFKWDDTITGTGFVSRQARAAYNGSFGAELDILSNLPPAGQHAGMFRYVPIDVTERLELQVFWRADILSRLLYQEFWLDFYDGARRHTIAISYDQPNTRWMYLNDIPVMTPLPGSEQTIRDGAWNELTLSGDLSADRYIRMKSNNIEIGMSDIPCRNTGNLAGAHLMVWMATWNQTADQLRVSIDDAVLKELEN